MKTDQQGTAKSKFTHSELRFTFSLGLSSSSLNIQHALTFLIQRAEDSVKSPNPSSPFLDNKNKLNDQFKMN